METKGISKRFRLVSPAELISQVKARFSLYPHVFDESSIVSFIRTATSDFSQDSNEPVVLALKGATSVIDLTQYDVNEVLEVITSSSAIGDFAYGRGLPLSLIGYSNTFGGLAALQTNLMARSQMAQTTKDVRGHIKFDYDSVTGCLYLRERGLTEVRIVFVPEYRLTSSSWMLVEYQEQAYIENVVQFLVWKNAEVLSKAGGFGVTTQVDPSREYELYKSMRETYQAQSPMSFSGMVD